MKSRVKNVPIHFVLSGGAAKGFYHIGMLKAFEQLDIKPASITGTSAGALFGSLWALYGTYDHVKEKIDSFMESDIYKEFSEQYFTLDILNGPADTGDNLNRLDKNFSSSHRLKNSNSANILSKRERLQIARQREKLEKNLGSIADLTRLPAALFVVDVMKEKIAVREANRLGIPVFAIVDTNSDPSDIDFVIPANDDATKSIQLITNYLVEAIKEGLAERKKDKEEAETKTETDAKAVAEAAE